MLRRLGEFSKTQYSIAEAIRSILSSVQDMRFVPRQPMSPLQPMADLWSYVLEMRRDPCKFEGLASNEVWGNLQKLTYWFSGIQAPRRHRTQQLLVPIKKMTAACQAS